MKNDHLEETRRVDFARQQAETCSMLVLDAAEKLVAADNAGDEKERIKRQDNFIVALANERLTEDLVKKLEAHETAPPALYDGRFPHVRASGAGSLGWYLSRGLIRYAPAVRSFCELLTIN
jgi:hypothetical protein